ncbi:MAG: ABC transporter permease [Citromicrobium sp.]|nr:ABC transporter permease [Citromicrobium sp.]MAO94874.1 ABC transporter permease [Citromicrobium sp.]MAS86308.1 ABC transporter permease [Erythrobacteraceae bacterium]MBD76094.1 ABC transporter permease [Citromicrobium sp.]MBT46171.1 ABC transporter permease [Citromicrobium sp.]|tara:strand:- start:355 stop:1467 length:1113 start_codon:yes stop_codon:yes gene_type:complete
MGTAAQYTLEENDDGRTVLRLAGPYLLSNLSQIDSELRKLDAEYDAVDLADVTEIDTVGAWFACQLARKNSVEVINASERAERLIDAVGDSDGDTPIDAPRLPLFQRVSESMGTKIFDAGYGVRNVVGFMGQVLLGFAALARHPRRFRYRALVSQVEKVGVNSLPIIGLMSFLIGIVIAQQGAVQLQAFGAESLTVNLVGRITLRELGVLMTAIMVAGRSGSAFAAQIGTMKLTEEIDAMRTIGIAPVEALVIPRILACVFMMVLLGFYASIMSIIGGAVIADLMLDIPFWTFLYRIQEVVPTYDLWVGLIKAPVFGLIIALSGCYQGMQVHGNSEEVGQRTTKAVVQAIFTVIVLDAFFAVFFTKVGWG